MDGESMVTVVFTVRVETQENESVRLVGDIKELGMWSLYKGVVLERISRNTSSRISEWMARVLVPKDKHFHYRYVIVESNQLNPEKLVVKRWESFRACRSGSAKDRSENFGINGPLPEVQDVLTEVRLDEERFGYSGEEENIIDKGFLTCQTEVQLRFHNAVDFPLVIFAKEAPRQFNIRVKQYDMEGMKDDGLGCGTMQKSISHVTARTLKDFYCEECYDQEEHGNTFRDGEYLVLSTQTVDLKKLVLEISVLSTPSESCPPLLIGRSCVVASQLQDSVGKIVVPLTKDMIPIGQLTVDYLVVKPFEHPSVSHMEHSFAAHWDSKSGPVQIGHRGLGSSFDCVSPAYLTENTIGSFVRAYEVGADYIEFDVLLSKDGVPVVFHDFNTDVLIEKKGHQSEVIKMEVKDLTMEQLYSFKSPKLVIPEPDQKSGISNELRRSLDSEYASSVDTQEGDDDTQSDKALNSKICPTLQEVLQHTPPSLHFDLEVKYPVYYMNDIEEREAGSIDMNKFLDAILETVFENAGDRKIVFSCFEPDVCTMLRLKQHSHPVLFLTCCINEVYTMYKDLRSRSLACGTSFALSEGLTGLCMFSTPLLKEPWKVQKARDAGIQVMFTWGAENDEAKIRKRLEQIGLDGIIYDRIYEANLKPKVKLG